MTDKLHCPFCGAELVSDPEYLDSEHFHCENEECIFPSGVELHSSVWKKMIDGKKAQDALIACGKHISDIIAEWNRHVHDHKPSPRQMVIFACRARDEITSITALEQKE